MEYKDARNAAQRDLTEKLRLERIMKPRLRSIFKAMRDDFIVLVANTGTAAGLSLQFVPKWNALLSEQYRRTQRAFVGQVDGQEKAIDEDEAVLALALQEYREQRSTGQSDIISRTNQNEMEDAIRQAREIQIDDGGPVDNRTIAVLAAAILARKFSARVDLIAMTETQNAAEATKAIEVGILSGQPSNIVRQPLRPRRVPVEATKTWITMGDNKVRDTHKAVNGTKIPTSQPFQVGSSFLMFPGDMSLGAAIKETINCRCSAVYSMG